MTVPMNTGFTSFESLRRQVSLCGVLRGPDGLPIADADMVLRRMKPATPGAGNTVRAKTGARSVKNSNAPSIIQDTDEKNEVMASTSTRSDGSFYFVDLPEGDYTLSCEAVQAGTGPSELVRLHAQKTSVVVHRLEPDLGRRTKPTVVEVVLERASLSSTGRRREAAATEPDKG